MHIQSINFTDICAYPTGGRFLLAVHTALEHAQSALVSSAIQPAVLEAADGTQADLGAKVRSVYLILSFTIYLTVCATARRRSSSGCGRGWAWCARTSACCLSCS